MHLLIFMCLLGHSCQHGFCCFHVVVSILHAFDLQITGNALAVNEDCCRQTVQVVHDPFCQVLVGHDACECYIVFIISIQCDFSASSPGVSMTT